MSKRQKIFSVRHVNKQHRFPFKSFSREKPKAGELIHSDVCGKISQESVGGVTYFVSFKNDCTAYRMIYFIKHKFDVFEKFKEYVNLVKNKFQRHMKILRIDNGEKNTATSKCTDTCVQKELI